MWCYYPGHKDKSNTKSTNIENQVPDASDSDTKLSSTNSKVTSNKTRIVHTVKKPSGHKTLDKRLRHDLTKEVEVISIKELTKKLINGYNILASAKFFANDGSQFFLIFQPISQTFRILTGWNNHTMKMPRIVR